MNEENNTNKKVVTRFAPSPTGFMHVGNVRTAIFAYLWAKKNNGTFILRIEDTDKDREVAGSKEHILESLQWLGLVWDEGPDVGGQYAPYTQSERLHIYKNYADILISKGYAYVDGMSEAEAEVLRQQAEIENKPFLYREHRKDSGEKYTGIGQTLRFKINEIISSSWDDMVFGKLTAGSEALDDFVLIKADGYPTYNFAHLVDDIEMGVTHVMRGQEFISSTPKYLALYKALEHEPPLFVSMPHILADSGQKKLGKRDGAKDILEYRQEGYLPSGMFNFLAFLGFNPGGEKEVYTQQELIEVFDIERIQKSGARFNDEKLDWINKEHIKLLSREEKLASVIAFLPEDTKQAKYYSREIISRALDILTERVSKWNDITKSANAGELDWIFNDITIDEKKLAWKNSTLDDAKKYLDEIYELLKTINEENWNKEKIKEIIWPLTEKYGRGEVLWPLRFCLTGMEKSPEPFTVMEILGKKRSLNKNSI
jgi:nondiscriminating glutamyl-tRNA synthetase